MRSDSKNWNRSIVARDDWTPEWAKKVVWYQIFPERFRNGNSKSNPRLEDIKGAYPHETIEPWQVHPWTSDWYELQPYEKQNGRDIWFNIQRRRYGGDIAGIFEKLDYLEDLGIRAIYLNPVFESPSHHKYDGATYHHIDPNFGPDSEGDRKLIAAETPDEPSTWVWTSADKLMLELIKELHRRDIRVIFDGVFNHMGINSWAFQDVKKHQQGSKYRDWFQIESWGNSKKNTGFKYRGWFGVRELPEIRQDENGIVDGPKQYIYAATRRWMDPMGDGHLDAGVDGWRLDVAFCIAHPFWKEWRELVKSINPEAYLTAEVIDPIDVLQPYLEGDEFDAVMNYNFAFACSEYFIDEKKRISTTEFDRKLRELREAFPAEVAYGMQNLLDSHDSSRVGSQIVNHDKVKYRDWQGYIRKSKATNPHYDTRKPNSEELRIQKLLVIFQMTYLGAPMVYYGDEVGMWGANDPDCRKPMIWDDMEYRSEIVLPDGSRRDKPDEVKFSKDLFDHYKKLIHIRNSNRALQLGDYQTLLTDDKNHVYSFGRSHDNQNVIVIINNSNTGQRVRLNVDMAGVFRDCLNGNRLFQLNDRKLEADVERKWARILIP